MQVVLGKSGDTDLCLLSHSDCREFSEILLNSASFMADVGDDVGLEVTSPGVEKPLRMAEDFMGAIGQTVFVRVRKPTHVQKKVLRGLLVHEGDTSFKVIDQKKNSVFSLEEVDIAHVELSNLKSSLVN